VRPFPQPSLPGPSPAPFQKALLRWYDLHRRDLPWRRTRDPYAIFISEMMLQQTQVKTALPYYDRWMKALPSWKDLDRAPLDEVLGLWAGLGYYRRARNLKAAARLVMERHKGRLPDDEQGLRELPGVGPYSAGAILSIAFQRPVPLVDGNVARVLARVHTLEGDPRKGPVQKTLWGLAHRLLSTTRPGDFNQALMELGALVCTPADPACGPCPLRGLCQARRRGEVGRYPTPTPSQSVPRVFLAVAYAEKKGRVLLRRRPEGSRWWQGLWELPSAEGKSFAEARKRLEETTGFRLSPRHQKEESHQVTNHKLTLRSFAVLPPLPRLDRSYEWVPLRKDARPRHPMSAAHQRLLEKHSAT